VSFIDTMARTAPDLLPGTLDLLILRTLQKEALHGWAISERIYAATSPPCVWRWRATACAIGTRPASDKRRLTKQGNNNELVLVSSTA
jgi:hypothetical protein